MVRTTRTNPEGVFVAQLPSVGGLNNFNPEFQNQLMLVARNKFKNNKFFAHLVL